MANDYTVRFENRHYQLDKPIYPGKRGGKVVIELRLDGTMAIRLGKHYLKYHEIASGPSAPQSLVHSRPTPEEREEVSASGKEAERLAYSRPTGAQVALLRSPILPTRGNDTKKGPYRPAADHPWRRGFPGKRKE